jgi:hypothetical protein
MPEQAGTRALRSTCVLACAGSGELTVAELNRGMRRVANTTSTVALEQAGTLALRDERRRVINRVEAEPSGCFAVVEITVVG